jgi:hypothetical protein
MTSSTNAEPIQQHIVPRHLLARFVNDDSRLTVVRQKPAMIVLRRQAPENVGTQRRFNSYQDEHGQWHHDLETGPLASLDGAGSAALDAIIRFGIEADAEGHVRLYNAELEDRAGLQLFIASLMVRTAGFRESWDEGALPTLLSYMRGRLEEEHASGNVDEEVYDLMKRTLETPGRVRLNPPPHHHQARLVPLIEKVATRLHLDSLVAVRCFAKPLLFTGAEPVVIFPDADPSKGCASGKFFTSGEKPVEFWQKPDELWAQLEARLATIAGVAVAVNPHTAILMFNPDTEDGGKLAHITSQVQPEGLAGLMNLIVAAGSAWVAGRDDCEVLSLLVQSAEHARSQGRRVSLA